MTWDAPTPAGMVAMTPARLMEARRLLKVGYSGQEIAGELNVTLFALYQALGRP